jgi:hypothetical protein
MWTNRKEYVVDRRKATDELPWAATKHGNVSGSMKPISLTDTTTVLFTYTYTVGTSGCTRNFTPADLGRYMYLCEPTNNPTLFKGASFSIAIPHDKKIMDELAMLQARIAELEAPAAKAKAELEKDLLSLFST